MKKESGKLLKRVLESNHVNWSNVFKWFFYNAVVALALYLCIEIICCDRSAFYVLNKEGFNGYFYAWSVTLLAGSLLLLRTKTYDRNSKKDRMRIAFMIITVVLLLAAVVLYAWFSGRVTIDLENLVDSIKIDELRDPNISVEFNNNTIDLIADSINTEEFIGRIDNEHLKKVFVHYYYKIVNPKFHWNRWLVVLSIGSFFYSLIVYAIMGSKKDD